MEGCNVLAILVSALVSFAIGFLWFTVLFRAPYMKGVDKTQEELAKGPSMALSFAIQIGANLVLAFVLAWLINSLQYETISQGIQLAFLVWLGFVVSIIGPIYAFEAKSFQFFMIIVFGYLASILATAIILSLWK
ncbi:uncharacterized protein DUF1761 [Flavobacterium sp. 270]|uniref:DUF1761 domain-containing protein n=1 Tax=Flavobacterium sp. 270 TaxID=2512114 RepID=UPI001065F9FF|nr:DUF1761 domain-containing protein [Flavobacterium sp. 270]TDW49653.1 uncharacterized protein DUF1761 [Flavobacterium sp. 270]